MYRTYIRIKYKPDEWLDHKAYQEAAYIIARDLMKKLDSESPKKANDSFGELCIVTKNQMTINEMKAVVKAIWDNTMKHAKGSINGFYYRELNPKSFTVSIQEVEKNELLETTKEILSLNDNIIDFFAMQDLNRVLCVYDKRAVEIERKIKTVADCLNLEG